jgi:dihydropyrimidine dehydrogenase (NAD+) subunit PreA
MSTRLQIDFCGIKLENPCLLASAPPTQSREGIAKALRMGWAGAITKTCAPDDLITADTANRFAVLRSADGSIAGLENIEGLTRNPLSYWENTVRDLKREFPHKAIISSIMADPRREIWQDLARRMEAAGADALELNLSCPHFRLADNMGATLGKNEDTSAAITAWVKAVVNIPVIVKLTPNVSNIQVVAVAVQNAGADALAAINTVQCLMGIDIETLEPLPAVKGYGAFGGYSGAAVKPIGLRCVAQLAQSTNLPLQGIGGIGSWQDVVEYFAVGASAVQICTAVMLHGYGIIAPLLTELETYLQRKGIAQISALTGAAIPRITVRERLDMHWKRHSEVVAPEKCTRCAKCLVACSECGQAAIQFVDKVVTIDKQRCDGCSLCTHVCPQGVLALR